MPETQSDPERDHRQWDGVATVKRIEGGDDGKSAKRAQDKGRLRSAPKVIVL